MTLTRQYKKDIQHAAAAAATKSLQSCPTLCDPIDGSPPGSPVPGILKARTLEWVAISFSNAWKWKVKGKSLSCIRLLVTPWLQPTRLCCPWDFPGKSTAVGCHCLLHLKAETYLNKVNLIFSDFQSRKVSGCSVFPKYPCLPQTQAYCLSHLHMSEWLCS